MNLEHTRVPMPWHLHGSRCLTTLSGLLPLKVNFLEALLLG